MVALKFVPKVNISFTNREIQIYSYLDAIDNPDVEKYGIPNVYYYGKWGTYMLTVFSLFDYDLMNVAEHFPNHSINSLILFRDFVSASMCVVLHRIPFKTNFIKKSFFYSQIQT